MQDIEPDEPYKISDYKQFIIGVCVGGISVASYFLSILWRK